ncbi:hypothetical protein [Maribacter cobaltidurans]|uniref:Uncharacterized protein n=1 Tax=Maribacter cobaltidurans TaxID=1178778 RepID=A0A223VA13_9FLAO|nr:hypothetical protein [Maribacter cobaltidurans]ASV32213.1 hypothetical protein CJ263_19385 [Maribacter cobaltidurans]GGD90855.1 hypothetical protein GCM10011412_31020 [Maribacter cobaltidurans]
MELEELQATWSKMSQELEKQKKLTNEIIMKMTQDRYQKKFSKLRNFETIGAIIGYFLVGLILFNFGKLDTWYLRLSGVVTIVFFTLLPTIVLRTLARIQNLSLIKGTYRDILAKYTREKNRLLRLQQVGIGLSLILMPIIFLGTAKIIAGKNVFLIEIETKVWIGLSVVALLSILVSLWGYRSYKRVTNSAELLLKDLED